MVIFHIDLPIKNSDFPIFHSYVNVYQRLPPSHRPPHGLGIIAQRQVWPAVQQHREAQGIGTLHLHVQVPNQGLTWLAPVGWCLGTQLMKADGGFGGDHEKL